MAPTLIDHFETGLFTGLGSGVPINLPVDTGAPVVGYWDVISVNSDATISTPAGFTVLNSNVNNQGSYVFGRKAVGGESAGVTIASPIAGDHDAAVCWSRWSGVDLYDTTGGAKASVINSGGTATPAVTSGTLATAVDLVLIFACTHNSNAAAPTGFTPSAGYTDIGEAGSGAGGLGTTSYGAHAYKFPAGTAAESPSWTWTNQQRDRDVYVVPFTTSGDVTIPGRSGGAGAGSSQGSLVNDKIIQGTSGGSGAGSSRGTLQNDRVVQGASGGAGAGSSRGTLVNDQVFAGRSGGSGAGSSAGALLVDKVIAGGSGGAGAGSSAGTLSAPSGNVTIQGNSGGAGAGGSAGTVQISGGVVHDTMVMPVLVNAKNCLFTEEQKVANPAAKYMIRPGATFTAMADSTSDECCSGIAWVRPGPMWESDNFPEQRTDASRTDAAYYAVQVELGVIRCLPTISDVGGDDASPTEAQWLAASIAAMDDAAAIRRAICCLRDIYGEDFVIAGQITPLENEADCAGMTTVVTMRVPACDCVG